MNSYFKSEIVSSRVKRIIGLCGEMMYLVEGDEKAAVIDAGTGIGNLEEYIRSLTRLPFFLIVTHGHMDHAGGAAYFPERYLSPKDFELERNHNKFEMKKKYLSICLPDTNIPDSDIVPDSEKDFLPLHNNDEFKLGGITLKVIELVGHTKGMMCVLLKEERSIVLGDACNPFTFMFLEESSPISLYLENLLEFKKWESEYDAVYLSHGNGYADKSVLDGVIGCCRDILEGKSDDIPFEFMNQKAYIAKAVDGSMSRLDKGIGNIVFNKNNI